MHDHVWSENLHTKKMSGVFVLPLATALGAWSVFPKPPSIIADLQEYPVFSWFCVFVLLWQGGGGQNIPRSAICTLILYVLHTLLSSMDA